MARSRSGSVGQFILTRSVEGCALEACHFQPIAKLLPRSLADEAVAACRRCRSEANSSAQRVFKQGSKGCAHAVHLYKSFLASFVGIALLIVTILNPLTTVRLIEAQLTTVHMLISGEQEADDDEDDRHRPKRGGSNGSEDEEADMDDEEREIARAAARYQLAIESERLRIFGPSATAADLRRGYASSPTTMWIRSGSRGPARSPAMMGAVASPPPSSSSSTSAVNAYVQHHCAGATTVTNRGLGLSLDPNTLPRTQPVVLTPVPSQPSWRQRRTSLGTADSEPVLGQALIQEEQTQIQIVDSPELSKQPCPAAVSNAICESTEGEGEEEEEAARLPRLDPLPYSLASSSASTSGGEETRPAAESTPDMELEHFPTQPPLSPATTLAHDTSDPISTADLLHLYGPPLSPSFGPLDDAEDLARVALGTAAASRSAMLVESERALDRFFQAHHHRAAAAHSPPPPQQQQPRLLPDPDELDLDGPVKQRTPTKRRPLPWQQCPLSSSLGRRDDGRRRESKPGRHGRSGSASSSSSGGSFAHDAGADGDGGDTDVDSD